VPKFAEAAMAVEQGQCAVPARSDVHDFTEEYGVFAHFYSVLLPA